MRRRRFDQKKAAANSIAAIALRHMKSGDKTLDFLFKRIHENTELIQHYLSAKEPTLSKQGQKIPQDKIEIIRDLRKKGQTIASIADVMKVSIISVWRHTVDIKKVEK